MIATTRVAAGARNAGAGGDLEALADQLRATGDVLARQLDLLPDDVTDQALGGLLSMLTERVDNMEHLADQLVEMAARATTASSSVDFAPPRDHNQ